MTTYVKPHSPLISSKKSFYDYELEHSFNKRLSCLVGVTVISFIIGVAALSISVLLLLQTMGKCEADMAAIEALHQRVEFLERKAPATLSNHLPDDSIIPDEDKKALKPIIDEVLVPPGHEDKEDAVHQTERPQEPRNPSIPEPVPVPVDVPVEKPSETFEDDEDNSEGSGDKECPQFSRPLCPIGIRICYTKQECPVPVCCPSK